MTDVKIILFDNNSEQAVKLLMSYSNFEPSQIDIIKVGEVLRKDLLENWLFKRTKVSAIYTNNYEYMKKRRLWVLFLCIGNSKEKLILEGLDKVTKLSTTKSIFSNSFLLILELLLSALLWFIFITFLPFYSSYLKISPKQKLKTIGEKKVLLLRTNFWFGLKFGGSVSHIEGFTNALRLLGYDVEFISSDRLENVDAKINVVAPSAFFNYFPKLAKLCYNFTFFRQASKIIRENKPLFIYHRHDELTFSNVLLARKYRVPLILEFNSSEVWKKKYWGGHKSLGLLKRCEEIALHGADHIVTVSEVNKQNLWDWYKIPKEKITVNPNGVDISIFQPNDSTRQEIRTKLRFNEKIVVGFVGSFGVWHGVDILASVINDVVKANSNVHFLWVGDGPYKKYVLENTTKYNLQGNVTIVEPVPHSEIPKYINACDILASPHTPQVDGTEFFGSPTKLFEYMAVGKAIIASNLGQIGHVLEHMKDAILIKPGSRDELTNGILKLSKDLSLREYLGKNARLKVMQSYTWGNNAKRVIEALNSL